MGAQCEGPLVWFTAWDDDRFPQQAGVLECSACDYLIVTGSFHDEAHALTPWLREGLAS